MSVELLNVRIDNYSFDEAIERAMELIRTSDKVSQVVTINPEMFKTVEQDEKFANIVKEAEMVIPDGVGVKIALNMTGQSASRVPGVDFARELLVRCAKENYPVAIVGAKEEIVTKAVKNLQNEIENLNIVYYHNGYFENNSVIYDNIREKAPKLILVALGSPKQEFFSYEAKTVLSPALMIGIGGSLDVWSGVVKRAPKVFQVLGLEWLYRTISQPSRFKRIFPTLPMFLIKVLTHKR